MKGAQIIEKTRNRENPELKVVVFNDSITAEIMDNYKKFSKVIFIEKSTETNQVIEILREFIK